MSIDPSVSELYALAHEYSNWEPCASYRDQVHAWIEAKDEKAIQQHFVPRIAFGTAGLRARMAPGYHHMNPLVVTQTSQGFIAYLQNTHQKQEDTHHKYKQRGIIVGYDGRHNSHAYATIVANLFLHAGFTVYLFSKICATPFVPYAVLHYQALGGIMVTASHNPKDDNGYKIYWENGAQIIPPHDSGIREQIEANMEPWSIVHQNLEYGKTHGLIDPFFVITEKYYKDSVEQYCWHKEYNQLVANIPVTYTAMHGVGAPFTAACFRAFGLPSYVPTLQQLHVDPDFPTVKFPNPEEGKGALKLAMQTADENNSRLILANDPDADRLAVAEKRDDGEWQPLNGNEIAILLADWAWSNYQRLHPNLTSDEKKKCFMLASTVSSKLLQSMAHHEGFSFYDTLTGFKWMGNVASQRVAQGDTFLFAYEVEIGFLVGNLSYDKDGIRTAAIFNEMYLQLRKDGKTCLERLQELYAKYGYFSMNTSYFFVEPISKLPVIIDRLRNWNGKPHSYPTQCGRHKIVSVRDVTLGYDSSTADGKSVLPTDPSSQMLTFHFDNGTVCTLRGSGTEPKLKYYIESHSDTRIEIAQATTAEMSKCIIQEFIQPEVNQLKPPGA